MLIASLFKILKACIFTGIIFGLLQFVKGEIISLQDHHDVPTCVSTCVCVLFSRDC
jgi:thiamine transporter ThiT